MNKKKQKKLENLKLNEKEIKELRSIMLLKLIKKEQELVALEKTAFMGGVDSIKRIRMLYRSDLEWRVETEQMNWKEANKSVKRFGKLTTKWAKSYVLIRHKELLLRIDPAQNHFESLQRVERSNREIRELLKNVITQIKEVKQDHTEISEVLEEYKRKKKNNEETK